MSSLLSYHIFSFFISNIFKNFKFGRNFSKFTAGMGCRLIAVSVKIAGNRRLPIGKENTGGSTAISYDKSTVWLLHWYVQQGVNRVGRKTSLISV